MTELWFSEPALAMLDELQRDQARWPVLDAVDDALDDLAADPAQRRFRMRRFRLPDTWMFPLATPEGAWMVLWDDYLLDGEATGDVHIVYIGPIPAAG